ncbi:hypothetical protein JOF56_004068 [Kibdelosporangium banguiense]|uniref:DUF2087 domain-containing protein n=1 Tax=Kibdelosporangium banguiense TaxID=1365924 RepID=A0ABS4TGX1_9PSEU|nr:DUF2087 domain-containing protein [Kibdelosporangium banguiense]MBP2323683.1 hypothetical protein [Kibdelosporangium banguiense]
MPMPDTQVEKVFRTFIQDGHLTRFPAKRARRRILLEHIASSFEPGRRFPEKEVDVVLRAWCAGSETDHVTLRRYLIDEELLSRSDGEYWRTGGWVDLAPSV